MAAYPPEWQVHGEPELEAFHLAPGENQGMGMAVLAKADLAGHLTGHFRCCIFGAGPSRIRVPATRYSRTHPPTSRTLFLRCLPTPKK